jgi:bifunctional non-homologous end joining protein LigD
MTAMSRDDKPHDAPSLDEYRAKRDFEKTPEPGPRPGRPHKEPIFVVQEHHASHLHYDFRLEAYGVLKSCAVPKGPSLDPTEKRLAVQVEDHPIEYASFEGDIPEGQYGAGHVIIWDHGTYEPLADDVSGAIEAGRLEFVLRGERLKGRFALIRMKARGRGKPQWLLIKAKDEFARAGSTAEAPAQPTPKAKATPAPKRRKASSSSDRGVTLTHADRVMFPEVGLTKGDVFAYYRKVADRLLPFLKDRPVTLERLPDGLSGPDAPHFWQKNTPASYPDWIPRIELPSERGKPVHYALVNDEPTLLYLVNQGTMTFHVWSSRVANLDRPDFVLFDLDPGGAAFADVVAVARAVRSTLEEEGREAFVKTSGKSGLHVLVPWAGAGGFDEARAWALEVAKRVAALPDRATVEIRKAKRGGRVYIDVLQNARGHHAVPPYVLRAVPAATVSTPLDWKEVKPRLDPSAFTIAAMKRRLARRTDPMEGLVQSFSIAPRRHPKRG